MQYRRNKPNKLFGSKPRGTALVEIALSSLLTIALAGLGADITLIILAMSLNDAACRDAARAAAQQSSSAGAISAAQAQLNIHATDGFFISQPVLASQTSPNFVYNDYSGNPPANQSPYVTVTTSVSIKLPAPVFFYGVNFLPNGSIQFQRTYTYPIIKQKFYG